MGGSGALAILIFHVALLVLALLLRAAAPAWVYGRWCFLGIYFVALSLFSLIAMHGSPVLTLVVGLTGIVLFVVGRGPGRGGARR